MKYRVENLSLEEKLKLLTGKNTWMLETANGKLPSVFLSDGPHGLRMYDMETNSTKKATAMPTLSLLACTWDTKLAYLDGQVIADDCVEHGADVLLAPGVNMKRTPLCGRNFEYFSEDPYLAGYMAKSYIEGVQEKGIGASLKHFCLNNREYDRFYQSSEVDERTIREIYCPAFEIALEANPWTVMCAYNPINGIWASENKKILKNLLRDEFNYDGVIVSDWGAVHQSARAVKASLDLEMPYRKDAYEELRKAYESGFLTMEEIDERVKKLLSLMEKVNNDKKTITYTKKERHEKAVLIAKEGMVLLKNEDGILPLKGRKVVLQGPFRDYVSLGGFGSSYVETDFPLKKITEALAERNSEIQWIQPEGFVAPQGDTYSIQKTLMDSYNADAVVLFMGNSGRIDGGRIEGEGFDRTSLRLPENQEKLILSVTKINPNVIVVLEAGSAVDMSPWIDKVKGVLYAGMPGEGAQEAIADLLLGKSCPCGKLAETFPMCLDDTPTGSYSGDGFVDNYAEGIFIGYRWYEKNNKRVLYPFGYGLSYASFVYSDIKIEKKSEVDYNVSFTITNNSQVDGKEISQLYVRDVFSRVIRPNKELKGFNKVFIKAGESKRVSMVLNYRSFAFYSTALEKWHIENGDFEILIGSSSQDIRLKDKISIQLPESEQYTM